MATHDYVIANGTGAAVRSDLNNALAAIVSNNSGTPSRRRHMRINGGQIQRQRPEDQEQRQQRMDHAA